MCLVFVLCVFVFVLVAGSGFWFLVEKRKESMFVLGYELHTSSFKTAQCSELNPT